MSRTAAANIACVALSYCGFVGLCGRLGSRFTPARSRVVIVMEMCAEDLVNLSNIIFNCHAPPQVGGKGEEMRGKERRGGALGICENIIF